MNSNHLETLALHAGHQRSEENPSAAIPINRTTAYNFRNAEHAANLFALKELGYIYTRIMNPTQDVLEQRMAALEGGAAALALASGTSAVFYSIINICTAGDEIVSSSHLYGGTFTMFNDILPDYGITVRFVDPLDLDAVRAAVNDRTRAVFVETIGNPALSVPDLEALASLAHDHRLPLIVDATFTTPALLRPIDHGADIVVNSLTKWIGGHGTGIGGIVVDAGRFDWTDPKFKTMNEPDGSYHGVRFAHDLGPLNPVAYIVRMRVVPLRNLGSAIAPDNAWIFLQGMETLALRMERHCQNALKVAEFLHKHPKVEWVNYPGLSNHPTHANARRYLKRGYGGMVVFGIKGGRPAGERFINSLEMVLHLANVGDAKSLAIHPASTTHSQMTDEQQRAAGVPPEMVRLSIGIEHIDDIIADLDRALNA
ncbi:MAG: O-acetylhomoserine aminocarboxypropyltransferase/cysteine synthase [Spirochaetaceae bacterium]|nr:MAG: O-acetylhomoserine aminocarboxypropyltransferase/cysteine synthase [Spirochaetaceae bacterium]